MAKLSKTAQRRHAQACQLVDLRRDLTKNERWFVLTHWQESSTTANGLQGTFFTPEGLAQDMSLEVGGDRIIDLGAGIGRLAWHNRDLFGRWPHPAPEFLCVERNPAYVRVGRKVLPEATWLCADLLDLPDLADQLGGTFDCAISCARPVIDHAGAVEQRSWRTSSRYSGMPRPTSIVGGNACSRWSSLSPAAISPRMTRLFHIS